jgi:hypothetical protein
MQKKKEKQSSNINNMKQAFSFIEPSERGK